MLEPIQFTVTLTKDLKILKQLKINRLLKQDIEGPYVSLQFDAQEFKFRPGIAFTVGKTIGNALIRSSAILMGDSPLSDDFQAFVVKLSETKLGVADVKQIKKSQFACPICSEDMKSGPKLARHLMDKKAHLDYPETAEEVVEVVDESDFADGAEEETAAIEVESQE